MVKILYVEDNEDNIYMLKMRLERKNFEMLIARNGKEGVKLAATQKPELILMDVGLPEMDGYEATRLIKENPATKPIPIIILTAHATVQDREKAFSAGADDYETKPVNLISLLEKINKQLN